MVYKLVLSKQAETELYNILDYLSTKWNENIAKEFANIFEKKLDLIKYNPFLYPSFKNNNIIRKCVVVKQVSVYYRISNDEVQIITVFDSRQNPDKLNL